MRVRPLVALGLHRRPRHGRLGHGLVLRVESWQAMTFLANWSCSYYVTTDPETGAGVEVMPSRGTPDIRLWLGENRVDLSDAELTAKIRGLLLDIMVEAAPVLAEDFRRIIANLRESGTLGNHEPKED